MSATASRRANSEQYQLDDLPDEELADPVEVDYNSSMYSRLTKHYEHADLVGSELHASLAKLVDNLLKQDDAKTSEKQDDASL